MNSESSQIARRKRKAEYARLSLPDLAERIIQKGDMAALLELHDYRTVFQAGDGKLVCLAEYVDVLRQGALACGRPWSNADLADQAYSLTIDKFSRLPTETSRGLKREGPDCRFYLMAFVRAFERAKARREGLASDLADEAFAAALLQKLVKHHYGLSLKECRRHSNPQVSRYTWNVDGGKIALWLPVSLCGKRRQAWLQANIENPHPARPGERERIQGIINQRLPMSRMLSFEEIGWSSPSVRKEEAPPPWSVLEQVSEHGLAAAVAEEKSANIHLLRPAIQALGKGRLRLLVLHIFEALSQNHYQDGDIARHFGLSKATFSRFAGSRWGEDPKAHNIPDLWRNTAQTLARHPVFVEAAKEAGVWNQVANALGQE